MAVARKMPSDLGGNLKKIGREGVAKKSAPKKRLLEERTAPIRKAPKKAVAAKKPGIKKSVPRRASY